MTETRLFDIKTSNDSLIVTLPRPGQVMSWALLHGGLRTHVQHIVIHQLQDEANGTDDRLSVRKAASRARLSGTIVGMCSTASVADHGTGVACYDDLRAEAVCVATVFGLATVGETSSFVEGISTPRTRGGIHLVIATNYLLTHEAMVEAMSIAIEAKVQAVYKLQLQSRATGAPATGSAMDCVAVTCGYDRRYLFAGKSTKWGELIGSACIEALGKAFQNTLACAGKRTAMRSRARYPDGNIIHNR